MFSKRECGGHKKEGFLPGPNTCTKLLCSRQQNFHWTTGMQVQDQCHLHKVPGHQQLCLSKNFHTGPSVQKHFPHMPSDYLVSTKQEPALQVTSKQPARTPLSHVQRGVHVLDAWSSRPWASCLLETQEEAGISEDLQGFLAHAALRKTTSSSWPCRRTQTPGKTLPEGRFRTPCIGKGTGRWGGPPKEAME